MLFDFPTKIKVMFLFYELEFRANISKMTQRMFSFKITDLYLVFFHKEKSLIASSSFKKEEIVVVSDKYMVTWSHITLHILYIFKCLVE